MSVCQTRRCVTCREYLPRETMIRVHHCQQSQTWSLEPPQGLKNHASGRSAYVCARSNCVSGALKGRRLQKSLKTSVPDAILSYLEAAATAGNFTLGQRL